MAVFWLASYPRSGSTWLRALLTNYLRPTAMPASIDDLVGGPSLARATLFDELLGVDSRRLTATEIRAQLPRFYSLLAERLPARGFLKVHRGFDVLDDGTPIFPPAITAGVVYIVRNPLDVAVSYAHHAAVTLDRMVAWMNDGAAAVAHGGPGVLPQPLGTWSEHVSGWLDQRQLPVHVVRYEDLLARPETAFTTVLRHIGLEVHSERVRQAVFHSSFKLLQRQEAANGFREAAGPGQRFFRVGMVGGWRSSLSVGQVRELLAAHGATMARFGYFEEASAWLAEHSPSDAV